MNCGKGKMEEEKRERKIRKGESVPGRVSIFFCLFVCLLFR